jgi:hypothetical protein
MTVDHLHTDDEACHQDRGIDCLFQKMCPPVTWLMVERVEAELIIVLQQLVWRDDRAVCGRWRGERRDASGVNEVMVMSSSHCA